MHATCAAVAAALLLAAARGQLEAEVARLVQRAGQLQRPLIDLPARVIPIAMHAIEDSEPGGSGSALGGLAVEFCIVFFDQYKLNPSGTAFFDGLQGASGCAGEGRRMLVPVLNAVGSVAATAGADSLRWKHPDGVVFHTARCGSTGVANMLAAVPDAAVLSEPPYFLDALTLRDSKVLSAAESTLAIRLLSHLAAAGAAQQMYPREPQVAPAPLFVKMQSISALVNTDALGWVREAWPKAEWALVSREPAESSASLLKLPAADASDGSSQRLALLNAPCMRSRALQNPVVGKLARDAVARGTVPDVGLSDPGFGLTAEAYCATNIAAIIESHLTASGLNGSAPTLFVDYRELPEAVLGRVLPRFGFADAAALDRDDILAAGAKESKGGGYERKDDAAAKRAAAGPAVRRWSDEMAGRSYAAFSATARAQRCAEAGTMQWARQSCEDALETEAVARSATIEAEAVAIDAARVAEENGAWAADNELRARAGYPPAPKPQEASDAGTFIHSGGLVRTEDGADACPGVVRGSFFAMTEAATAMFHSGRVLQAEACWRAALDLNLTETSRNDKTNRKAALENLAVAEDVIRRATAMRHFHKTSGQQAEAFLPKVPTLADLAGWEDVETPRPGSVPAPVGGGPPAFADPLIAVYDGVLSDELCDYILEVYKRETSDHYQGNMLRNDGSINTDLSIKYAMEVDVSYSPKPEWAAVDWMLTQALAAAFQRYKTTNAGYRMIMSPLGDEGFRIKGYHPVGSGNRPDPKLADQPMQHNWHVDASGSICRSMAFLFYLNDVDEGGETLFLTPAKGAVKAKKGRVLIFPTNPGYLHAGSPPLSDSKYIAANFFCTCIGENSGRKGQRMPALGDEVVAMLRKHFSEPAADWKRPADAVIDEWRPKQPAKAKAAAPAVAAAATPRAAAARPQTTGSGAGGLTQDEWDEL